MGLIYLVRIVNDQCTGIGGGMHGAHAAGELNGRDVMQAELKAEEAVHKLEALLSAWLPHWLEQYYQQVCSSHVHLSLLSVRQSCTFHVCSRKGAISVVCSGNQ